MYYISSLCPPLVLNESACVGTRCRPPLLHRPECSVAQGGKVHQALAPLWNAMMITAFGHWRHDPVSAFAWLSSGK